MSKFGVQHKYSETSNLGEQQQKEGIYNLYIWQIFFF